MGVTIDRPSRRAAAERPSIVATGAVAATAAGGRLLGWLPDRFTAAGTDLVADLAFLIARRYRARSMANLRRALGPNVAEREVRRTARAAFRTSARNVRDLLLIAAETSSARLRAFRAVSANWAPLDNAVAEGRGVVIVTAHLGAFDGLAHVLASRGYPLSVVVGQTLPGPVYAASVALRRRLGMTVIEATPAGVRQTIDALRRGGCAGIVGDRDFFDNGDPVCLFGSPTRLPSGAVRLARESGAPMVAAFLRRSGGAFVLETEGPYHVARTADRVADVARGMVWVTSALERAIAGAPDQWAMFQLVWPEPPEPPCASRS